MPRSPAPGLNPALNERPASFLIVGRNRALTNWIALSIASALDPSYLWTEFQSHEQDPPGSSGPLVSGAIPDSRLSLVFPEQLIPNEEEGRLAAAAAATVIRSDEEHDSVRGLEQFVRLPLHTQEILSAARPDRGIRALVLANAERVVEHYPRDVTATTLAAILRAGCTVILSFVGPPPPGRAVFDYVLEVPEPELTRWREASLHCEKGSSEGPFRSDASLPLSTLPGLAGYLEKHVDGPPRPGGALP